MFASTHLDAQSGDTSRLLQAQKIVDILKQKTLPVILAGDFNAVVSTPLITIFDNYFTRTCTTNCGFTVPVINHTRTIDFIVYGAQNKFTVTRHRVIAETYSSDHRPVMAVLQLQ
ncbi:MAG: endonuclease/exonuclease/phosphatase family protein [Chitinophagaceae bacterium]|nr:endonuclease/exonuclease/phosphatase family protein [Chitinophagaceae bacterium]